MSKIKAGNLFTEGMTELEESDQSEKVSKKAGKLEIDLKFMYCKGKEKYIKSKEVKILVIPLLSSMEKNPSRRT